MPGRWSSISLSRQLLHMASFTPLVLGGPRIVCLLTWRLVSPSSPVGITKDSKRGSMASYNRVLEAPESCFHSILPIKNIARVSPDTVRWESGSNSQSKEHHKYIERRNQRQPIVPELTEIMHLKAAGTVDSTLFNPLRPYKEHTVKCFLKLKRSLRSHDDYFLIFFNTHMAWQVIFSVLEI